MVTILPPKPAAAGKAVATSDLSRRSTAHTQRIGPSANTTIAARSRASVEMGHAEGILDRAVQNDNSPPLVAIDDHIPNILIFGESGIGKSSLINMVAGENISGVAGGALGYTFESKEYTVNIGSTVVRLWDTAGLNEGENGTVPAEQAMRNLQELVHKMKDGISLLIYCIRGTRFKEIMKINYDLFSGIICQKKVPVVLVITSLENESPMEKWWEENGTEFQRRQMTFHGHACVTTTKGKQLKSGEYMFEEEFEESQEAARRLIKENCNHPPWIIDDRNWLKDTQASLGMYYNQGDHQRGGANLGRLSDLNQPEGDERSRGRLVDNIRHIVGWVYTVVVGVEAMTSARRETSSSQYRAGAPARRGV